jgi:hypothetical protein
MTAETLFRYRVPLEVALLVFAIAIGWLMARRSD